MSTSMSATSQTINILTFTLPQPCASICLALPISTPRIFCVAEAVKLHSPSGCPMKARSDSRSSALGATRLLQYWMLSCKGSEGLGQRPGVTMFPVLLLHFWSGSKPARVRLSCTNPCKCVKILTKFNSLQDALKQVYDSVLLNVPPTMGFCAVSLPPGQRPLHGPQPVPESQQTTNQTGCCVASWKLGILGHWQSTRIPHLWAALTAWFCNMRTITITPRLYLHLI